MRLPRRVGDAAELRKVGTGDRNLWQVGWARASFLTVLSAPSRPPQSLKPLLEKRRRARINQSLSQLKGLVLPLLGAEVRVWELRKQKRRVLGHPARQVGLRGPGALWGSKDLRVICAME